MEFIDLGLSVKWADTNVGANSPEEFGKYFTYNEALKIEGVTMPTRQQWRELVENCKAELTKDKKGYVITGKNSNSIYIPIAGEGKNSPNVRVNGAFLWALSGPADRHNDAWFASFNINGKTNISLLDRDDYYISVRGIC